MTGALAQNSAALPSGAVILPPASLAALTVTTSAKPAPTCGPGKSCGDIEYVPVDEYEHFTVVTIPNIIPKDVVSDQ